MVKSFDARDGSMRLLYLNHNFRYLGSYYRAMPLAEQMAKRGHAVTLLCISPTRSWSSLWSTANGVRVGEMPGLFRRYEGYGPLDILSRGFVALARAFDIVHMFDHKPNVAFPGLLAKWRGARLVADWADWWSDPGGVNDRRDMRFPIVSRFDNWLEVRSKLWADGVVTISTALEQRARQIGIPDSRLLYLPSGASIERIHPVSKAEARRRLGIPEVRLIVGFIGSGQGHLELVMRAQQKLSDVWLMVIGPAREKTLASARSLSVADRLWQTGQVDDDQVSDYLAAADVMCLPMEDLPADRGRLPNKLLDYMAAGRPTIASPIGDVRMIMEKYKIGVLATGEEFTTALDALLRDPSHREELGRTARHIAESVFGWPRVAEQLEAFYFHLHGKSRTLQYDHISG
jgi:glycosyltransferase involved in cell wall biosynthesis